MTGFKIKALFFNFIFLAKNDIRILFDIILLFANHYYVYHEHKKKAVIDFTPIRDK